jgi:hypothetical protein
MVRSAGRRCVLLRSLALTSQNTATPADHRYEEDTRMVGMKYSLRALLLVTTLVAFLLVAGIYLTRPPKNPPLDVGDFSPSTTEFIR